MTSASRSTRNVVVALGVIVSSSPKAALLAALQQLRPPLHVQLQEIAPVLGTAEVGYRVEIDPSRIVAGQRSIDLWMQIKSALMAQFPADKPGAVAAID